jgi:hypothetical protein
MTRLRLWLPLLLVLGSNGRPALGQDALEQPGPCWQLVVSSDAIVQGRLVSSEAQGASANTRIMLDADRWLKGEGRPGRMTVVNRVGDPAPLGQAVIAFLEGSSSEQYYLTEHREASCLSLRDASENPAAIADEIARQQRLRARFPEIARRARATGLYKSVSRDVEALVKATSDTKAKRFRRLVERGRDGIPALVVLLDDDRPVARGLISVTVRGPNAFEGVAHYNARTVFEVLDLALGEITGTGFGMGRGDDVVRNRVLDAWRIYLADGCPRGPTPWVPLAR